jgi:hypothetical protein
MNRAQAIILVFALHVPVPAADLFVNFETAPVHPIALNPSGTLLAACNLPDGQLEIFNLQNDAVAHRVSIPVGLDPVTVRFRNESEMWLVNSLSDSINVIDAQKFSVSARMEQKFTSAFLSRATARRFWRNAPPNSATPPRLGRSICP